MSMVFRFIAAFGWCVLFLGCGGAGSEPNIWDQVKITDLAAPERPQSMPETINVAVFVFETEASHFEQLDDMWDMLSAEQLEYDDESGMERNACRAAFGHQSQWPEVVEVFSQTDSHRAEKTALLLVPGEQNQTVIKPVEGRIATHYAGDDGSLERIELEGGDLNLSITAEPGDSRGTVDMRITPVFARNMRHLPGITDEVYGQRRLDFLSFEGRLSEGDFIVFGPTAAVRGQETLGGLMFSKEEFRRHLLTTYVIACTATND